MAKEVVLEAEERVVVREIVEKAMKLLFCPQWWFLQCDGDNREPGGGEMIVKQEAKVTIENGNRGTEGVSNKEDNFKWVL